MKFKPDPAHGGQEDTEKVAAYSHLVGGSFTEQGFIKEYAFRESKLDIVCLWAIHSTVWECLLNTPGLYSLI